MTLIIGIGNPLRGDDGAGRALARRLMAAAPGLEVAETDGEATRLMALLEGRADVILVDACRTGAAPGTLHRLEAGADAPPGPRPETLAGTSSHGFGPAEALALAAALGRLPARVTIHAVEAQSFAEGAPLSAPVAAAVETLAQDLAAGVGTSGRAGTDRA